MDKLRIELGIESYDIIIGRDILRNTKELFGIGDEKIILVTDSGVPSHYAETVAKSVGAMRIVTVESGEGSKSIETFRTLLRAAAEEGLTRKDAFIAVGGGVVGDLTGYAAASYMRGISFYNIPTTVLSMVDSSIGGKTAINLDGIKNIVGAFHQPKGVLIDTEVLRTLEPRQIASGLAESVKMAACFDGELFSDYERLTYEEILEGIGGIIYRSLGIKKSVVEADVKEAGLRRVLNFGHTFGHCIESSMGLGGLYHGEAVALGTLAVSGEAVRERLVSVYKKLGLPTSYEGDIDEALGFLSHDKKCVQGGVAVVLVDEIGAFRIEKMTLADFGRLVKGAY